MATCQDLVTATLQDMGITAADETPSSADSTAVFNALNRLIDAWQTERLEIYTTTRTTFTIVSGTSVYLVGTGLAINVARPIFVDGINYQDTALSVPVEINLAQFTEDQYRDLPLKSLTSSYPTNFYYNPLATTGSVTLWPKPTGVSTLQGVFYCPVAVPQFAALSDVISLPPGYQRMLVKNLALEISPLFQRQPDPILVKQAMESKEQVQRVNRRLADLSFDFGVDQGGRYSVFSDSYV